jgi:hypothetical protein
MANFKDWFINSEDAETVKPTETPKTTGTKFPTTETSSEPAKETHKFPDASTPSFTPTTSFNPSSAPVDAQSSKAYLEKALDLYEKGFESLNQDGFDFFEYYKSIVSGGDVKNPQLYVMAFQMASAMDKTITKEKLIQQSDFYLAELDKIYRDYVAKGNAKRDEILNQKSSEQTWLTSELQNFEQQLEGLKVQIEDRKSKLSAIDGKFASLIAEVEGKISANETASSRVTTSIKDVKNGIISNIK